MPTVTVLGSEIKLPDDIDGLPQFVVDEVMGAVKRYNQGAISIDTYLALAGCATTILNRKMTTLTFEQYVFLKGEDAMSVKKAGAEVLKVMFPKQLRDELEEAENEADSKNASRPKKADKSKKDDIGKN